MGARGVFTVLGLTATAGAAYLAFAPVSAGLGQQPPTTIDPAVVRRQDCMRSAFGAIDAAFERARVASRSDLENSVLNLDGDSSWLEFGTSLQSLDTRDCPADYRTAMIEFSNAWLDYGVRWRDASMRLSLGGLSAEDAAAHLRRIDQARNLMEDIAHEHDVSVRRSSYTISS